MSVPLPPAVQAIYGNGAEEGTRNTQLFKLACQFRDQGLAYEVDVGVVGVQPWGVPREHVAALS